VLQLQGYTHIVLDHVVQLNVHPCRLRSHPRPMLFRFVVGLHVERWMGGLPYLAFYLICGLSVNALEIATAVGSNVSELGVTGALGAIAGSWPLIWCSIRRTTSWTLIPVGILDWTARVSGLQPSISPNLCGVTTRSACPTATNRDASLPVISPSSATSRCSSDSTKRSTTWRPSSRRPPRAECGCCRRATCGSTNATAPPWSLTEGRTSSSGGAPETLG
jgi:hypothetical protein